MPLSSEAEDAVDDALHNGSRYLILVSGYVVNMTKLCPGHSNYISDVSDMYPRYLASVSLYINSIFTRGLILYRSEILVLHEETNIEVTRAIMQCLLPGAWLNDEVR